MNKDWSEKNKTIQQMIGKEATYKAGIKLLIEFRSELFEQITQIVNGFPREAFDGANAAKTQEILGQDMYEGLTLREKTKW